MGLRGTKKTPTNILKLKGNPGKRPLPINEPQPTGDMPDPPSHLDAYALEEWNRVCDGLHAMGVLYEVDMAILAAYCASYSRWRTADEELQKLSIVPRETESPESELLEVWDLYEQAGRQPTKKTFREISKKVNRPLSTIKDQWYQAYEKIFGIPYDRENITGLPYHSKLKLNLNPLKAMVEITKAGNMIQHPLIGISNVAKSDCIKYAAQLGMTPSARASLGLDPRKLKKSKFVGLISNGKK